MFLGFVCACQRFRTFTLTLAARMRGRFSIPRMRTTIKIRMRERTSESIETSYKLNNQQIGHSPDSLQNSLYNESGFVYRQSNQKNSPYFVQFAQLSADRTCEYRISPASLHKYDLFYFEPIMRCICSASCTASLVAGKSRSSLLSCAMRSNR